MGPMEIAVIGGLILLLFGAKKLPELAKGLGQSKAAFDEGLKPPVTPPPKDPSSEEDEDKDDAA